MKNQNSSPGTPFPAKLLTGALVLTGVMLVALTWTGVDSYRRIATRQRHGHGFGLHSAALTAQEMGGSLSVHCDGLGQGAVFTLELPLTINEPTHAQAHELEATRPAP